MPETSIGSFPPSDLLRRVGTALDLALHMMETVAEYSAAPEHANPAANDLRPLLRSKVISETALLLHCAEPIADLDSRLRMQVDRLTDHLIPLARQASVAASLCQDPENAPLYATAHLILSQLGFPDPLFDELYWEALQLGADFGADRLPYQRSQRRWLERVWPVRPLKQRRSAAGLSDTQLGRPLNVLSASRLDIYGFTHAVMFGTGFGAWPSPRVRSHRAVAADADAALTFTVASADHDLTAEVLMCFPMLRLSWSTNATFAFHVITESQNAHGFLPGLAYDETEARPLRGTALTEYVGATCYHPTYVMGMLCAVSVRTDHLPSTEVRPGSSTHGLGPVLFRLLRGTAVHGAWCRALEKLTVAQQNALAPMLFTVLARHFTAEKAVESLQSLLHLALDADFLDGPVPMQSLAFLRRLKLLSRILTAADAGSDRHEVV